MDERLCDPKVGQALRADSPGPTSITAAKPGQPGKAESETDQPIARSGRETMLAFALVALLGGMFFVFLNLVTFGIFFYVLAAVVGIMAIGFLHYVLWGYDLSEEVAEEMQRERLKQQQEMDERL
ncbi:MAG: hypothetical protein L0Y71_13585 [Gemmataceae bacterium]|nr:hypothetical protein [Gemmataceae bacterium]